MRLVGACSAVTRAVCGSSRLLASSPQVSSHRFYAAQVVDMRSDCLSQPTDDMRRAMAAGTMGDDVFDEDRTVHELQDKMAVMFGMEAALFVPSGTMGNLIAVMCHCDGRGREVLFGSMSHLVMYEQGGVAQLGGIMPRTMPNKPDGTFDLDQLESYIRPTNEPDQSITSLVTIENTHGNCGGKVIPLDFLAKLRDQAEAFGLPVHMDGARVMNAAVSLDVEPREILQYVDSTSMCLSKGIGAPVGSVVGGSAKFISQARRLRKVLGGGWRQPGPLAAAALVALRDCRERIAEDHRHAKMLALGIMETHSDVVHVDVEGIHSNIVMVDIFKSGLTAAQLCNRLNQVTIEEGEELRHEISLLMRPARMSNTRLRCYLHSSLSLRDVAAALTKWRYVIDNYQCIK